MNGLTNAALSILLSWLRALMGWLWSLINTGGSAFVGFLSAQWKPILLVLCVGGTVLDMAVYIFRWRPYYVWRSKLTRRRRAPKEREADAREAVRPLAVEPPEETLRRPSPRRNEPAAVTTDATTRRQPIPVPRNSRPVAPQAFSPIVPTQTRSDAPLRTFAPAAPPIRPPVATAPLEPPAVAPNVAFAVDPTFAPGGRAPVAGPDFAPLASPAAPRPMTDAYLRDVQTGFAPPPKPEELYRKRAEPIVNEPVHPGLDARTLQQNIGLTDAPPAARRVPPPQRSFAPYANLAQSGEASHRRSGIGALAKKARSFVGVSDDEDPPSIRDLQPTVNITDAYHAPVFPKRPGEEDS